MHTPEIATRNLAGVAVPDTPLVARAMDYACANCEPYLFNHVVRSWLFAVRLGQIRSIDHDEEVVALGALLHDTALNERFVGPRRFEVEGADLARTFAREAGVDAHRTQLIWDSVALNSTPSIAFYKEAEVALCTSGIALDVIGLQYELIPSDEMKRIVGEFPRLDMKSKMSRCFCYIAQTRPETTYDNFVRDFGERFVSGYKSHSTVDLLMNAPFSEGRMNPDEPSLDAAKSQESFVHASCAAWQREVPISEAVVPEATDYLLYLSGLDCYQRWRGSGEDGS
jgi:Domain of unknown function (DUF3330)